MHTFLGDIYIMDKLSEISKIARNINVYYMNRAGSGSMPANYYEVLRLIVKYPGCNSFFLADRMNLDKGLISRIVLKLSEKGYIESRISSQDRRSKLLYPLKKAVELKLLNEKERDTFYSYLEKFIPEDQKETFFAVLDILYEESRNLRHEKFASLKNYETDTHR